MSLTKLQSALRGAYSGSVLKNQMSFDAFAQTEHERGNRVHRFRRYYDGDHDAGLTEQMRDLLRVSSAGRRVTDSSTSGDYDPNSAPFNANYMPMIVDTKVDRLELTGIDADNAKAQEWAKDQLTRNRIDHLNLQVCESASRDGDTYIFIDFNEETGYSEWVHEPAYDGVSGMVLLYPTRMSREPELAIKIWHITSEGGQTADTMRVNTYSATEIRRYISHDGGELKPVVGDMDDLGAGVQSNPLGVVPVAHFANQSTRYDNYGRSDIDDAIPLQDTLNRTMVSMVATAELTAFKVRYGIGGFEFPAKITPGMFINLSGGKPVGKEETLETGEFEAGNIVPFVEQANWVIDQIFTVTKTPKPNMGSNESGEAKKQNEAPLLGKVKRAQISYGGTWEKVLELAWLVESVHGKTPPEYETFNARWAKAEVRNDKELMENAALLLAADSNFPIEEYYRIVAPVFGWDEDKIEKLASQRDDQLGSRLARLGAIGDPFGAIAQPNGNTPELATINENGA